MKSAKRKVSAKNRPKVTKQRSRPTESAKQRMDAELTIKHERRASQKPSDADAQARGIQAFAEAALEED